MTDLFLWAAARWMGIDDETLARYEARERAMADESTDLPVGICDVCNLAGWCVRNRTCAADQRALRHPVRDPTAPAKPWRPGPPPAGPRGEPTTLALDCRASIPTEPAFLEFVREVAPAMLPLLAPLPTLTDSPDAGKTEGQP